MDNIDRYTQHMKKRILIFDFDGTIADTFHAMIQISNQLAEEYHFKQITLTEAERMKDNTLKETIHQLNIPLFKIPIIVAKAKSELFKDIAKILPVTGLKEILTQLKMLGIQMGILTSNSTQNVEEFLKNHDLQVFEFIKSTSKIWGKDIHLSKIITARNFSLNDVIYVGDEARDVDAARRSGIKVAAVTWGYNSGKTLLAHSPDYLVHRPEELLQLIR